MRELIPIIESAGKISDSFDVVFLSEVTRSVSNRLGELPGWYYKRLGQYYKEGERGKEGVFSSIVYELVKDEMKVKRVKPDPNDSFGDWLNHLSHPYYFRSYRDSRRPTRVFLKKGKVALFRIDRVSSKHGRIVVEGTLGPSDAKLKVVSEKPLPPERLDELKRSISDLFAEVFVIQGGGFLGYR